MADGCINTHMVRLLGAPPLLNFILISGGQKVSRALCLPVTCLGTNCDSEHLELQRQTDQSSRCPAVLQQARSVTKTNTAVPPPSSLISTWPISTNLYCAHTYHSCMLVSW